MDKICKNCKWWKFENDCLWDLCKPIDLDTGSPMKFLFQVKPCQNPKLLFYERPVEPNQAALVDGSQYRAAMITGEQFSCSNFTPND